MEIKSMKDLIIFCKEIDNKTLYDILSHYTNSTSYTDIISGLDYSDALMKMADQNNVEYDDMVRWIVCNLNSGAECDVVEDNGPYNGWATVKVSCLDMTFFLNWIV